MTTPGKVISKVKIMRGNGMHWTEYLENPDGYIETLQEKLKTAEQWDVIESQRNEELQARIAELEWNYEAACSTLEVRDEEIERLDAALVRVRSMICANSRAVETLKVIDTARVGE
jgi:Tfp pilus assembly protein FimV